MGTSFSAAERSKERNKQIKIQPERVSYLRLLIFQEAPRARPGPFAVILRDARGEGERVSAPAELLGEFCGVRRKDGVDIWHSEIRFQQGVDGQGTELFAEGCKARAADAVQQESGLPAKLPTRTPMASQI